MVRFIVIAAPSLCQLSVLVTFYIALSKYLTKATSAKGSFSSQFEGAMHCKGWVLWQEYEATVTLHLQSGSREKWMLSVLLSVPFYSPQDLSSQNGATHTVLVSLLLVKYLGKCPDSHAQRFLFQVVLNLFRLTIKISYHKSVDHFWQYSTKFSVHVNFIGIYPLYIVKHFYFSCILTSLFTPSPFLLLSPLIFFLISSKCLAPTLIPFMHTDTQVKIHKLINP